MEDSHLFQLSLTKLFKKLGQVQSSIPG